MSTALRLRAPLALLAFASALGCGGGGSSDSQALRTIRVFANPQLTAAPLLLAESEGFFRDEGLAIEWVRIGSSRELLAPLIQGDLDVLTSNLSPVYLNAIAQGARVRVVADKGHLARNGCNYLSFLTRPELLRDGRLVHEPGAPRWRVSYRRGSFYELLFDRALAASGLPREEFEPHHLTGEIENQALAQGSLDVSTASGAPMQALVDSGAAAVWLRAQDLLPDAQAFILLYGPELLDRDPETGIRFMTAYLRGIRRYNLGKTRRNVEVIAAATAATAEEVERACWIEMRDDGRIHTPTIEALGEWAFSTERLTRRLQVEEVWEPRFVEAAAARLGDAPVAASEYEERRELEAGKNDD